jgi:hypothetical protein
MLKPTLIAAALAASLASFAPVAANAQSYTVRVAPPEPRTEVVPAPRRGYVWVPGYWNWNAQRHRHQWVAGTWVRERQGYYYNEPRWVERDGRWVLNRGAWARGQRDRDRDGVPNRMDRDRDGDGVPNRLDSNPNNPRRT